MGGVRRDTVGEGWGGGGGGGDVRKKSRGWEHWGLVRGRGKGEGG